MVRLRSAWLGSCAATLAACGGSGGDTLADASPGDVAAADSHADVTADSEATDSRNADSLVVDAHGETAPPKPIALCPPALKNARYVSVAGDDSNPGSSTSPFATIQHAIDVSGPGDVIHVLPGTYTSTTTDPLAYVRSANSGTASAPVVLCSDPPLAAKLDGGNTLKTGVYLEGPSTRVLGFEVTRFVDGGIVFYGDDDRAVGNVVHDIGHVCTDTDFGKTGIYVSATNGVIDGNVIHSIGRLSPGEDGCTLTTTNYQNHDHAIYVEGTTGLLVSNNVFYDDQHGWDIHAYSGHGEGSSGLTIVNNTFAFANPYREGQVLFSTPSVSDSIVENNVFYQPNTEGVHFSSGGTYTSITVKNNLTTGAPTSVSSPGGSVDVSANFDSIDALLVAPTTNDFHLQPASPAIDRGLTSTKVTTDLEGWSRPQGSAYDLGAYEWHAP